MGIDLYIERDNVAEDDKIAHFGTAQGHVGYLREAYHGYPYALFLLAEECFYSETFSAKIPARKLRERLTAQINTDAYETNRLNGDLTARLMARICKDERLKEAITQHLNEQVADQGPGDDEPLILTADTMLKKVMCKHEEIGRKMMDESVVEAQLEMGQLPDTISVLEAVAYRGLKRYGETAEQIKDLQQSFIDFVDLAERLEKETGEPCTLHASF
jgi:hypothetical protein